MRIDINEGFDGKLLTDEIIDPIQPIINFVKIDSNSWLVFISC